MSKPIEEMVAVLWEAMLRQIETRIEDRIEAALANIPNEAHAALLEEVEIRDLALYDLITDTTAVMP